MQLFDSPFQCSRGMGTCPHRNKLNPTRKSSHRMQLFSDLAFCSFLGLLQEAAHRIMSWVPTLNCPWEKSSSGLQKEPENIRSSQLSTGFIYKLPNVPFFFMTTARVLLSSVLKDIHTSPHTSRDADISKELWCIAHLKKETLTSWEVCSTQRSKCVY